MLFIVKKTIIYSHADTEETEIALLGFKAGHLSAPTVSTHHTVLSDLHGFALKRLHELHDLSCRHAPDILLM